MQQTLIKDATIVNEGRNFQGSVLIKEDKIHDIFEGPVPEYLIARSQVINALGKILIPGVIDDQVHFREPGLTHKADIESESKAAIAGGITSFMEMPNTKPQTTTQSELQKKFDMGAEKSWANYSFFFGATNDNTDELVKTDPKKVCGVKVFMGSSTGNMLVDDKETLTRIFKESPTIVATHCEDEETIRKNTDIYKDKYGEEVPISAHPLIRSAEACYKSSSLAVELAGKYGTQLHILHISTAKEIELFSNTKLLKDKKITAEVCAHHLWFSDDNYRELGARIKWNPAVKTESDNRALMAALKNDTLDVLATDHAPHTWDEKSGTYFNAASGGPMVQHSLSLMLELYRQGLISLEKLVEKMCHNPAILFRIDKRGFIRKGYYADLAVVDLNHPWQVKKDNILYKCGWSPIEGQILQAKVTHTFVNGKLAYDNGEFAGKKYAKALEFNR